MYKIFIIVAFVLFSFNNTFAQLNNRCLGCVINQAHFGTPASDAVGLYPDTIIIRQNDTVNIDITYLMPKTQNITSPITGTATVTSVQILSMNPAFPLPSGLNITCDAQSTNCLYSPQSNRFGCVKVCGKTSDAATSGFVAAKITVNGCGSLLGQSACQNQDITVYYKILPDTTACHTVCFVNKITSGCDSATIGVLSGIDISCANPILNPCKFSWNYGNGDSATSNITKNVNYNSPGNYPVTLKKTTQKLVITGATFSTPSQAFGQSRWYNNICNGGLAFPNGSANNFHLSITAGTAYNTSGAGSGNFSHTWTGLAFDVYSQAASIQIIDNCLASTLTSNVTTVNISGPGLYNWNIGSDANGTLTVALIDTGFVTYSDTVHIYASPSKPIIRSSQDSLCYGDSARLTIGIAYAGYTLKWYQDSTFLAGSIDSFIYVSNPAKYYVSVTNPATKCQATSAKKSIEVSTPNVPVSAGVKYDNIGNQMYLNPYDPSEEVRWYYEGALVNGQVGRFLPYLGNGRYWAEFNAIGYRKCSVTADTLRLTGVGIEEATAQYDVKIMPNPNKGIFTLLASTALNELVSIKLYDMLGREVYDRAIESSSVINEVINLSHLAPNVYTLSIQGKAGRATQRVVIE